MSAVTPPRHQARALQARYSGAIRENELAISASWGKPCCAYNVHLSLPHAVCDHMRGAQAEILGSEPALLPIPVEAMHVSVAWLLAVHVDYGSSKEGLWARHGSAWLRQLNEIGQATPPLRIRYESVVVTDAAIIALAFPTGPVNQIRRRIADSLELPAETRNRASIVHTSLFRYSGALTDPEALLERAAGIQLRVTAEIGRLAVCRESVYPSLASDVLAVVPLRG